MKPQKPSSSFSFGHHYPAHWLAILDSQQRTTLPRALTVTTWLLIFTIIAMVVMLTWVPWVQTTTGSGRVTTLNPQDRVQTLSALVSGRIAQWYVQDAQLVRAGDPIVRIQDLDDELVVRLQAQLDAAIRKHKAARQAAETAVLDLSRQEDLYEAGLTSRLTFEQASIRVQQLRISEEQALSELNQAEVNFSRQGSQLVVAPRDGTILHVEAGDVATLVSAGQRLAAFLPANGERAVELYIDGRDIGLVRPGREVRLEFEGWPSFQFSGLPEFAVGTFAGEVVFVEPSARDDGRFRVLVSERELGTACQTDAVTLPGLNLAGNCGWPPDNFVRLGANVRGWLLLETVPLSYELWRLMNNFPPSAIPLASTGTPPTDVKK
jgi:multidrug efflux pump subunit AcrA (membrane-fusion protein)